MKIKAFTMAEVLIVLTILGVIAALTLPALNANIQKQQAGPALMRAISTLETANALVSQERDFYNFEESCKNYLNDCFEPFVKEKLGAAKSDERVEYENLSNLGQIHDTYTNAYTTKNGFMYYISGMDFSKTTHTVDIYVDINGTKRPNVIGKDMFYLSLAAEDEGSKLYAQGSTAFYELLNKYGQRVSLWKDFCNKDEVREGRTCGGSIVDNNGRVIYPWN